MATRTRAGRVLNDSSAELNPGTTTAGLLSYDNIRTQLHRHGDYGRFVGRELLAVGTNLLQTTKEQSARDSARDCSKGTDRSCSASWVAECSNAESDYEDKERACHHDQ